MNKDRKISMPQNSDNQNDNQNMAENVSCIEWFEKVPLPKKILTAAMIGLILLVIIVLAIVFGAKEGK